MYVLSSVFCLGVRVMVLNATFNNISVILWRGILFVLAMTRKFKKKMVNNDNNINKAKYHLKLLNAKQRLSHQSLEIQVLSFGKHKCGQIKRVNRILPPLSWRCRYRQFMKNWISSILRLIN